MTEWTELEHAPAGGSFFAAWPGRGAITGKWFVTLAYRARDAAIRNVARQVIAPTYTMLIPAPEDAAWRAASLAPARGVFIVSWPVIKPPGKYRIALAHRPDGSIRDAGGRALTPTRVMDMPPPPDADPALPPERRFILL